MNEILPSEFLNMTNEVDKLEEITFSFIIQFNMKTSKYVKTSTSLSEDSNNMDEIG